MEQLGENPVAQCRWFETWKPVNKVINHRIEISISSKNTVLENPVISSCLPHRINYMLSDFRYSDISLESVFDLKAAFWKIIYVKILVKLIVIY